MEQTGFKIVSQDSLPKTTRIKGSKYDKIIYSFLNGTENLVKLNITDNNLSHDSNVLALALKKRVKRLKLSMKIYVRNDEVYLEKQ